MSVLTFEPLFMERVWGGRALERFGRRLPDADAIGESWELVDRPEAQSIVAEGPLAGRTLGELWRSPQRQLLFGAAAAGERFPLLVKLLDCRQTLSVQVHPPAGVAASLGGEPKTEMWVILEAEEGAHLFTGLRRGTTRERFAAALAGDGELSALLHRHEVRAADAMFLPSGRIHAIGGGNVILEVQQNSDTTYRVFDWNRPGLDGRPRQLHVAESLRSIDWEDFEPSLVKADGERLVHCEAFEVDRLLVTAPREAAPPGRCAVLFALDGPLRCGGLTFAPGSLFLLVAAAVGAERQLAPAGEAPVTVLRAMLPG